MQHPILHVDPHLEHLRSLDWNPQLSHLFGTYTQNYLLRTSENFQVLLRSFADMTDHFFWNLKTIPQATQIAGSEERISQSLDSMRKKSHLPLQTHRSLGYELCKSWCAAWRNLQQEPASCQKSRENKRHSKATQDIYVYAIYGSVSRWPSQNWTSPCSARIPGKPHSCSEHICSPHRFQL